VKHDDERRKAELLSRYGRLAPRYDSLLGRWRVLGYNEWAYRRRAVERLGLRPGDTVVELGCGTGVNFPLLLEKVGPRGRVIGVDMSGEMLRVAARRARNQGWGNVELIESDIAELVPYPRARAYLSTFALALVPRYEKVVAEAARALSEDGAMVVLDYKVPSGPLSLLRPLLVLLLSPYGWTAEAAGRRPWLAMERWFGEVGVEEMFGGFVYLARAARPRRDAAEEVKP